MGKPEKGNQIERTNRQMHEEIFRKLEKLRGEVRNSTKKLRRSAQTEKRKKTSTNIPQKDGSASPFSQVRFVLEKTGLSQFFRVYWTSAFEVIFEAVLSFPEQYL
jgi:hypothetical protein